MSIYRIKQFMWAIMAPFRPVDEEILNKYLNKKEINIFRKMKISEQHHSIRVCRDALKESDKCAKIDKIKLAKIALLHDIGKIDGNLNIIDKSVIVILDKVTRGSLKRYTSIKKIDIYYNHPKISLKLLRAINEYDNEFLEAVERHHYTKNFKNNYLEIIKKCDDNN